MVQISRHMDLQPLRNLKFCFYCGREFQPDDETDHDHVPAETLFAKADRAPLKLPTHLDCNGKHSDYDEKVGQLIALLRGELPKDPKNRRLQFFTDAANNIGAVKEVSLYAMAWRWIRGFHAALYREPLAAETEMSLTLPLPIGREENGRIKLHMRMLPQHGLFVEIIKNSRARNNLDRIEINKGKLVYECVWAPTDQGDKWLCIFALNIYNWFDLSPPNIQPRCGCAGFYALTPDKVPATAARFQNYAIKVPNRAPFDPFGR